MCKLQWLNAKAKAVVAVDMVQLIDTVQAVEAETAANVSAHIVQFPIMLLVDVENRNMLKRKNTTKETVC